MNRPSNRPEGRLLEGDARHRLPELPDQSVDCIITSPPYWALRDYGHHAQIGTEATVEAWTDSITAICEHLARILTPTGALWLNLGDSYSRHPREGASKKSLLLGPERVAMRLTDTGWLLRNQIIWAKPNPMPSSVTDRLSTTHEVIYFFTRQPRYYFDLDAIRDEPKQGKARARSTSRPTNYPPRSAVPTLGSGTTPRADLNHGLANLKAAGRDSHPLGKNPGDVWQLPTAAYRGAHFAAFPLDLVRRPLLATCPQRVCTVCATPWQQARQVINGRRLAVGPLRAACPHAGWRPGRVLDPFLGSGTVAVAAEMHGRDWVGIELNPVYTQLARRRIADWRAQHVPNHHQQGAHQAHIKEEPRHGTTATPTKRR